MKLYCYDGMDGKDPHERILEITTEHKALYDQLPHGQSNLGVVVIDQATEDRVMVVRADCGLDCYCAARVLDPENAIRWAEAV